SSAKRALRNAEMAAVLDMPTVSSHTVDSANGNGNGVVANVLDRAKLLKVLMSLKQGDFSVRLPANLAGLDGKIADTFNDVMELNQKMARELERLSRVVGKEGRINQ